jgi:hypothetical protein
MTVHTQNASHPNWGPLALGLTLGLSLVCSTFIGSQAMLTIKREHQTIQVKGFAEKKFTSNFATWTGTFTTRAPTLLQAYRTLETHREFVTAYLHAFNVPNGEWEISPAATHPIYSLDQKGRSTNHIEAYHLSQDIHVKSKDIYLIEKVANHSGDLLNKGIEFSAYRPQYFYTNLEELKVSMLGQATEDARRRAEELAQGSGSAIGSLRHARQGVFQITPAHSTEISDYGRNDTSSREKAIKAVVTMGYAIKQ